MAFFYYFAGAALVIVFKRLPLFIDETIKGNNSTGLSSVSFDSSAMQPEVVLCLPLY